MSFKSEFIKESLARGFIYQHTDLETLDTALTKGICTSYTGFDPTGPSLHVGHLLPIMWLRLFQKMGHRPLVLVGGATSLIGDPSGKDKQRPLLTPDDIKDNIHSLTPIFKRCLDFEASQNAAFILNNYDWMKDVQYIDFLRNYGFHFSVNRMLTFECVKNRLDREEPLSFIEFNYMIFQAYDFLFLNRHHDCTIQMAGSDQWGNIVNGIELSRRVDSKTLHGLTAPLLTTASGAKMGKTANGAVWLNPDLLNHFDFWQYWRNTHDKDVIRFLKLFTDLPLHEISKLEALQGQELNEAKKILADHVTALIRGPEVLHDIHNCVHELFEKKSQNLENIDAIFFDKTLLPLPLDAFCLHFQLAESKGAIRRLIQGGGLRINDQTVHDIHLVLSEQHFDSHKRMKLSLGKKKHFIFKI